MAKPAVHGIAVVPAPVEASKPRGGWKAGRRRAPIGCQFQAVSRAKVNRPGVEIRKQSTRGQVSGPGIKPIAEPGQVAVLIERVSDGGQANLTDIAYATGSSRGFLGLADRREQQTGQYRDHRDYNEQLDQREPA